MTAVVSCSRLLSSGRVAGLDELGIDDWVEVVEGLVARQSLSVDEEYGRRIHARGAPDSQVFTDSRQVLGCIETGIEGLLGQSQVRRPLFEVSAGELALIDPALAGEQQVMIGPEQSFSGGAPRCLCGRAAFVTKPGKIVPDDAKLASADIALDELW